MRRIIVKIAVLSVLSAMVAVVAAVAGYYRSMQFDPELFSKASGQGTVFTDRYGRELRFLPDLKGERARWVPLDEVPEIVRNAFIAAEDERFYKHPGFDGIAILRAVWSNVAKGKIMSGASTISQQVVRLASRNDECRMGNGEWGAKGGLVAKKETRSYRKKLIEIIGSVKMEQMLSKDEILEQYLNRVPMGNNLVGVDTAARAYFGTSVKNLSLSEAALLASLPKAPSLLNPYGNGRDRLLERRNWVLGRMRVLGLISDDHYFSAKEAKINLRKFQFLSAAAPHIIDMLTARDVAPQGRVRTTIDLDLQQRVQDVLVSHGERLKYRSATQAAAIVIHNPTMEVLASVGSLEYSEKNNGFNNGVLALRSAGSALKPFLYALAIESGETTATLLADTERKYRSREGQYSPLNFDRKEYGPVTMRAALGNSLNLSAVKMLERIGEARFYEILQQMNLINHPERGPDHYGLGMAIGNPEVSPEQLAAAFAMLANGGVYRQILYVLENRGSGLETLEQKEKTIYREGVKAAKKSLNLNSNSLGATSRSSRLVSNHHSAKYILLPQTAYIITDILSDPTARALTFSRSRLMTEFPFQVAIKTGTSTFFRDLWAAGYTADYTVVVWVGNFDGSPTRNLSGSSAAVPIFADIMTWLYRQSDPVPFKQPKGVTRKAVCGYSGMKPSVNCTHAIQEPFILGTEPRETCTFHTVDSRSHKLGPSYAGWLYEKNRRGSAGRFRLSGFGDNLNTVFQDQSDEVYAQREPGIKPRNISVQKSPSMTVEAVTPEQAARHYRIGTTAPVLNMPLANGDAEIKITYPLDKDRFVLNRHEKNQVIKLQAVAARPFEYVDWFINGKLFKRTGPPYQAFWRLEEGKYSITAVIPSNIGDSVQVEVE